jgi:hypothetical protein
MRSRSAPVNSRTATLYASVPRSILPAPGGDPYGNSQELMLEAISQLREAGVEAGVIRPDIAPPDVPAMLTGTALAAGGPEQRGQAERLLDFSLDAMSTA